MSFSIILSILSSNCPNCHFYLCW